MRTAIAIMGCCMMLLGTNSPALAQLHYYSTAHSIREDPSIVVNRPANVQGLTGLIMTNSAFTQPKGRVVAGLATIAQNSSNPDFSIVQGIATVTAGVTDRVEVGLRGQLVATNLGSSATRETGFGDTDLMVKWRLSSQGESMPAIAVGLMYTIPTGDKEQGLRSVKDQAVRFLLIGSNEKEMPGDYFIGVYFEGQIVYSDRFPWEDPKPQTERYGVVNAGLLFPLTEERNLQLILEYNSVVRKEYPSVYEQNYFAYMPGLRYVTENWNVSLGVQFYNPTDPGRTDDLRYLGTISYAF